MLNMVRKVLENLIKNNNQIILIYPIPTQGWNVPNLFFYEKFNWEIQLVIHMICGEKDRVRAKTCLTPVQSSKIRRVYPENIFARKLLIIYALVLIKIKFFIQTMITFQKKEQN